MAPEFVAGGGYGGLIREKPHCALSAHRGDIALPAAALSTPVAATCSISSVVGMFRGHIQQGHNFISLWGHGRRKREDGERVPRSRETSRGTSPQKLVYSSNFFLTRLVFRIFQYFPNKVTEI